MDRLISVVDGEHGRKTVNRLSLTAQPEGGVMKFKKSIVGVLAMLPLVAGLTLTGCSGVLPTTLEEKLMSTPTADDHLAAARLYQNKARELEAEAEEYERAVSKLASSGDSKGFHHGALRMSAQEKRHEAKQMQELYASHAAQAQAQALHGKAQPQ